jgi:hypothetical protein
MDFLSLLKWRNWIPLFSLLSKKKNATIIQLLSWWPLILDPTFNFKIILFSSFPKSFKNQGAFWFITQIFITISKKYLYLRVWKFTINIIWKMLNNAPGATVKHILKYKIYLEMCAFDTLEMWKVVFSIFNFYFISFFGMFNHCPGGTV